MLVRMGNNRNSHSLLVEIQNSTLTSEHHWVDLLQNWTYSYHMIQQSQSLESSMVENLCPHRNLHMDANSSFIHNCQNLEATRMFFRRWVDKLWYIQKTYYHLVLKRTTSYQRMWKNLKCTLFSERSQPEKVAYWRIPSKWHSERGKTMETVKDHWLPGSRGERAMNQQSTEGF